MKQVFVYGDSLTWGIVPNSRRRLPFEERWTGVLESSLNDSGLRVRVSEDSLNGRRTVWDDPFKPGRNGLVGLQQRIESLSPLSLVVLMLGTNDFQFCHPHNDAWSAALGIAALVREIRIAPIEPGMPVPPILVLCPPRIRAPKGMTALKFQGAETRCADIPTAYREIAGTLDCHYFDANTVARVSEADGVHLDADQHLKLGVAVAAFARPILDSQRV